MREGNGDEQGGEEGLDALEELLAGGFFLGLLNQLQRQYGNLRPSDVEDAVATAVERLVKKLQSGSVRHVRKYLAKAAYNECNKASRRPEEDELPERYGNQPSLEDSVLQDAAINLIKAEVRTWENAHIREVVLVYIEMIIADEILEADEVAEIVSMNLGEEIGVTSVSQWKARGLRRLREFAETNELYERRRRGDKEEQR